MGLRQLLYQLRTEGAGPGREAAAVGVGVFIGCLPIYGFHLLLCIAVSTLLGLNRLKTYFAANISNPLVAPWLLLAEVQAGAWLRRGTFHELTLATVRTTGASVFGVDLLVGSVAIGGVLAGLAAWGTAALAGRGLDDPFLDLVRRAAERYARTSITAWEFARGKLRYDPIYRALLFDGLLAGPGRTLVDVGCGQGLTLALLAEARRDVAGGAAARTRPTEFDPAARARPREVGAAGRTRATEHEAAARTRVAELGAAPRTRLMAPPVFERLLGIEMRPRVAAIAAAALAGEAEITTGDARSTLIEQADAILFLDVLHMIPRREQEAVLAAARSSLSSDGVIVIREADASAGWRFRMVALGNRFKAVAFGHWQQGFHFRSVTEWQLCLAGLGLRAEARAMGQGTPFANVVFVVRIAPAAMASSRRTDTSTVGTS